MSLQEEIEKSRAQIKTDAYTMSVGEWMSLYQDNEVDIHPEFQRFFRWSDVQKSRFIESLLLGIPVPPIFVSTRQDGIWEVVDGLQRLSTLFEFAGVLKGEQGDIRKPLVLKGTEYLPSLEGKHWNSKGKPSLDQQQRLLIKRSKLAVNIVLQESDDKAKYELFQRLNTGGSQLQPQEIRNCIIVMLNPGFYEWLNNLAKNEDYSNTIALSDKNIIERYDLELILRFIFLRTYDQKKLNQIGDIHTFLTNEVVDALSGDKADFQEFDYDREERIFKDTFAKLNNAMSDHAFKRYYPDENRFKGGFILPAFETITLGIGYHEALVNESSIEDKIKTLWQNPQYLNNIGSGKNVVSRLPKLIPLGKELFMP